MFQNCIASSPQNILRDGLIPRDYSLVLDSHAKVLVIGSACADVLGSYSRGGATWW